MGSAQRCLAVTSCFNKRVKVAACLLIQGLLGLLLGAKQAGVCLGREGWSGERCRGCTRDRVTTRWPRASVADLVPGLLKAEMANRTAVHRAGQEFLSPLPTTVGVWSPP